MEKEEISDKLDEIDRKLETLKHMVDSIGRKDLFLSWFSVMITLGINNLINFIFGMTFETWFKLILVFFASIILVVVAFPTALRLFNKIAVYFY